MLMKGKRMCRNEVIETKPLMGSTNFEILEEYENLKIPLPRYNLFNQILKDINTLKQKVKKLEEENVDLKKQLNKE